MKKRIIALISVFVFLCSMFFVGCNTEERQIRKKAMQFHDVVESCCDYLDSFVDLVRELKTDTGFGFSLALSMAKNYYDEEMDEYNDNYVNAMLYYEELIDLEIDEKIYDAAYNVGYALDNYASTVDNSSDFSSFSLNSKFWGGLLRGYLVELKECF